ncbi:hybrid sensor histidine kinase/response regulator [Paraburkholderia bannensis]|uniref:hybrid sensor histidine kinase/response regulator n=1 Tax=Paraburkholderia bannensis TaxID=765414 RepID=UPI002AB66529|nr:ATP-binding protein [Paraburkholderia bannensis]
MKKRANVRYNDSPLRDFDSIEKSLQRERRVFSSVVLLLAFVTLAVAAVIVLVRLNDSLRAEEQLARLYQQSVDDTILESRSALTASNLIVGLRASDPAHADDGKSNDGRCQRVQASDSDNAIVQRSCNEAVQVLIAAGQTPSIEVIAVADGTAYRYIDPLSATSTDALPAQSLPAPKIVDAVLSQYRAEGLAPLEAAREKRVVWLTMPSAVKDENPEIVGASLIAKDNQIYAVALTRIALSTLLHRARHGLSMPNAIFFDSFDIPRAATNNLVDIEQIDRSIRSRQAGVFHFVPDYGWAMRSTPLAAGFGRLVFVLPHGQQLHQMASELLFVCAIATAILVLLFAMYRHWNYRFLVMTYEEAARAVESEMLNHLLVHATPVGLCIVRRETLEISVSNQITRDVLGLGLHETALPQTLRAVFEAHLGKQDTSPDSSGLFRVPLTLNRDAGSPVHLEITYAKAQVRHEAVLFCAIVDVTEHHHSNQLLRQAKLASDAAAKAKLSFFASMSHEIRTPLSSLVGNIELVSMGPLQAEQRERVRAMQVSAEGLLQVVNDVLDFSRIDVGALSIAEAPGSLIELLERIASSHAREASKRGLDLHAVFDRRIPDELSFDPVRVAQIVNNLLNNALKFTHSGKVVLRAHWRAQDIEIEVSDTGIGIPRDQQQGLFRPFSQATSNRFAHARGTGLGLSICAKLCELMGGRITLDSTPDMGTRVSAHLPLKPTKPTSETGTPCQLPPGRIAILFRDPEHYEALLQLFDWSTGAPVALSDLNAPVGDDTYDCLVVTEEFDAPAVAAWYTRPASVVWIRQQGPLLAAPRADGGQEVSRYSRAGIQTALTTVLCGAARHGSNIGASARHDANHAAQRPLAGLRVLVAEDNPLNRNLLRDQLSVLGAHVCETGNGYEALAKLGEETVDVVLTDIDMPDMNGFDLLDAIRSRGLQTPVYAVSASTRPEDVAKGRACGFADYFTKPVALAILARELGAGSRTQSPSFLAESDTQEIPDIPHLPAGYAKAFLGQTEADIRAYAAALATHDIDRLERLLHRIAGTLAVVESSGLLSLCQDLRDELRDNGRWHEEIESQSAFILQALTEMCERARADTARTDTGAIY